MVKKVLVTGANKGVGRGFVEAALDRYSDAFVYLGCSSLERGTNAQNQLAANNQKHLLRNRNIELHVTSEQSVCEAEKNIRRDYGASSVGLHSIVNNA